MLNGFKFKLSGLESNIWKVFLFILFQRRAFIPLLSIYFLTLPGTFAHQVGIFSGLGFLASFLFEIPSGYFADNFGHKRTLIISKFLMFFSTLSFISAYYFTPFWFFVLGSVCMNFAFAFSSGTMSAFVHDFLIGMGNDSKFSKFMGKLTANISLISMIFIILLPFTTKFGILFPFYISLGVDVIGIFVAFSFVKSKLDGRVQKEDKKSIFLVLREAKKFGLFPISIFSGAIIGFMTGFNGYRSIYLEFLGMPIIYLGFVMGLSRLVWFGLGNYAHLISEKISMKKHLFFEILIFSSMFILAGVFSNFYVVSGIFILVNGYMWARRQVMVQYMLDYAGDTKYKATMISLEGQVKAMFDFSIAFLSAYLFSVSYEFGFYVLGGLLFLILCVSYYFICKHDSKR